MNADLKQRIAEFLVEVSNPASLVTTREHLAQAVVLLREAGDSLDKLLVKAINNEGMADCMDMVYSDLKRAGIVSDSVPPMTLAEAMLGDIQKNAKEASEAK